MEHTDLSLIRPVAGLKKTARVSPTGRREERPGRQSSKKNDEESDRAEVVEEPVRETPTPVASDDDPHLIDFQA